MLKHHRVSSRSNKKLEVGQEKRKISLKATKVTVRKTGMNSGIDSGRYQCC